MKKLFSILALGLTASAFTATAMAAPEHMPMKPEPHHHMKKPTPKHHAPKHKPAPKHHAKKPQPPRG